MTHLSVGLLASNEAELGELRAIVAAFPFTISHACVVAHPIPECASPVNLWLVRLNTSHAKQAVNDAVISISSPHSRWFTWLEDQPGTIVYDESPCDADMQERERHRKHFITKIILHTKEIKSTASEGNKAKQIWVLAASTGGPEAMVEFVSELDPNIRDLAFIYAQHIEPSGMSSLLTTLKKYSPWPVLLADTSHRLDEQKIFLASPNCEVDINASLALLSDTGAAWCGQYTPAIDQLLATVARCYGENSGAIIFSGMGDDGAKGCRLIHYHKGQVWGQSPETCLVDSMVQCASNTGCLTYLGSPTELARKLNHQFNPNRSRKLPTSKS